MRELNNDAELLDRLKAGDDRALGDLAEAYAGKIHQLAFRYLRNKEDAEEVMTVVKKSGGVEAIHLAFYRQDGANERQPWHFWRLEGPGLVWNFRVLPHVHAYVNVAEKAES